MAVIGGTVLTYADWAKRMDPNGKVATIIELLEQRNEFFEDAMIRECNDGTTHLTTVRTGIPSAAWRMLNQGVPLVKSTTAQVRDTTGMLEAYSEVDKQLAMLAGDARAFRMSEAHAVIEGMGQQVAQTFFYGNTNINPERFLGLSPRFATAVAANADSAANVVHGGGTSSTNCSAWLVSWGEQSCHMIYPKGSPAGFKHDDLGEDTLVVSNTRYQIFRDHFMHHVGLSVRDWRFMVRVANLETASTGAIGYDATNQAAFLDKLLTAVERLFRQNGPNVRTVWYMNRYTRETLRRASANQIKNATLTWDMINGREVMRFMGYPVKLVEQLVNTEAQVPIV
jgi:hypothetical protein